jgi:hypothetical protein
MTAALRPLRFGLAGAGYWARITHAPALASTGGIEFAAIWGRDPKAAADLAATYHTTAHHDIGAFLDGIDGVAFAVPPDVQPALAVRAARAGKHLLLEKPVAISEAQADALVRAVEDARVASVVFFTSRFQADVRAWLSDVTGRRGWTGASAVWLGSALQESSPYNTPWRRDHAPNAMGNFCFDVTLSYLWVPKTCATCADVSSGRRRLGPVSGTWLAGPGLAGRAMIFGLWA